MRELNPYKVFAQYRERMNPDEPILGRKYTITHSDTTADLFVFISDQFAIDQITKMRDEVRITWEEKDYQLALIGSVVVDGRGVLGIPKIRNKIFYDEMPKALQALRQADRFLFSKKPNLDNTQVLIYFLSENPIYNKIYDFGSIGNYKI